MSKLQELLDAYEQEMKGKLGMKTVDKAALKGVAKSCGPAIYKADASKVSCSDKEELARVRTNFVAKKLGITDGAKGDAAIKAVCEEMGSSNRNKYRAIFYYLLAKNARKLSTFK